MTTEANQPINPVSSEHYSNFHGLTKREYFAAIAMQGMLSNPENAHVYYEKIVQTSILYADKLIEELNK